MNPIGRLHVITDTALQSRFTHAELAALAIQGGADTIQFRHKAAGLRELLEEGERVLAVCRAAGVPLIVNDRVDVALALDAEGVHLGPEDMPVPIGRRLMPAGAWVGASARTEEGILAAVAARADYVGYGPIFGTSSKADAASPRGLDGLARMCALSSCPIIAVGGITARTAGSVIRAGAHGIAVISAVCCQPQPREAARQLMAEVRAALP
ncbi:MAG: thiamine phosphate synthase [Candidatus Latescibacterota bacterium]